MNKSSTQLSDQYRTEDINKLVEWANKWQMIFNVDKCSVMHIGHNNMKSNYIACPINSCR